MTGISDAGTCIQVRFFWFFCRTLPENDRIRYTISPDARKEVLKRLLKLNHKIHEQEAKAGLHAKGITKKETKSLSCCIKDESSSLGFGDQKLESNRPMRHSLRVFVVSDKGKGSQSTMIEHIEVKDFTVFDGLKTENAKKAEEGIGRD